MSSIARSNERHRPAVVQAVRADANNAAHAGKQRAVGGSECQDCALAAQLFDRQERAAVLNAIAEHLHHHVVAAVLALDSNLM